MPRQFFLPQRTQSKRRGSQRVALLENTLAFFGVALLLNTVQNDKVSDTTIPIAIGMIVVISRLLNHLLYFKELINFSIRALFRILKKTYINMYSVLAIQS